MKGKQSKVRNKGVQDLLSYEVQISLSNPKLSLLSVEMCASKVFPL